MIKNLYYLIRQIYNERNNGLKSKNLVKLKDLIKSTPYGDSYHFDVICDNLQTMHIDKVLDIPSHYSVWIYTHFVLRFYGLLCSNNKPFYMVLTIMLDNTLEHSYNCAVSTVFNGSCEPNFSENNTFKDMNNFIQSTKNLEHVPYYIEHMFITCGSTVIENKDYRVFIKKRYYYYENFNNCYESIHQKDYIHKNDCLLNVFNNVDNFVYPFNGLLKPQNFMMGLSNIDFKTDKYKLCFYDFHGNIDRNKCLNRNAINNIKNGKIKLNNFYQFINDDDIYLTMMTSD